MKSLGIFLVYMFTVAWFSPAYGQAVKEKKISGRFPADRGKLTIDNQYGKLDINTWDRNEVTVDITITANGRSEKAAQDMLDKISIIEPQGNSGISYKTVIGKGKNVVMNGEMRIDYVVNMPRRHPAGFINKFGDIDLADVEGKLIIDLEYGALKSGNIKGGDKYIEVGFGSATIAYMETGTIKASYSKLSIDKAGNLNITNEFEKTTIGTINNLDIDTKYGDLKIGTVNQLKCDIEYAGLIVTKLLKSADVSLEYCSGSRFDYVGPEVDKIDMDASFSNLSFHFDNTASLSVDISSEFGNVKNNAGNITLNESKSDFGQTATYKGKIGSGRGTMTLKVSYGNVVFK